MFPAVYAPLPAHILTEKKKMWFSKRNKTLFCHIWQYTVTPLLCSTLCNGPWAFGDVLRWPNLSDILTRPDTSTINWACNRICFLNVADKLFCISNNRRAEISTARWIKLISWRTIYRVWNAMWRHWSHGLSAHSRRNSSVVRINVVQVWYGSTNFEDFTRRISCDNGCGPLN
jgi:hypothetical protein